MAQRLPLTTQPPVARSPPVPHSRGLHRATAKRVPSPAKLSLSHTPSAAVPVFAQRPASVRPAAVAVCWARAGLGSALARRD